MNTPIATVCYNEIASSSSPSHPPANSIPCDAFKKMKLSQTRQWITSDEKKIASFEFLSARVKVLSKKVIGWVENFPKNWSVFNSWKFGFDWI